MSRGEGSETPVQSEEEVVEGGRSHSEDAGQGTYASVMQAQSVSVAGDLPEITASHVLPHTHQPRTQFCLKVNQNHSGKCMACIRSVCMLAGHSSAAQR